MDTQSIMANAGAYLPLLFWSVVSLYLGLKALDLLGKIKFRSVIAKIDDEPVAAAIYFGFRFFGVAYLLGQLFGAVRF